MNLTDREFLLMAYGALKVLEHEEDKIVGLVEAIGDHLFPQAPTPPPVGQALK